MLAFRPVGSFVEHRLANCRLDAVRPDEDVARRGGPIVEAELDRRAWALGIALQSLGWEGAAAGRQAVQQNLVKLRAMQSHQSTWRVGGKGHDEVSSYCVQKSKKKNETSRVHRPHCETLWLIGLSILYGGYYDEVRVKSLENSRMYLPSPRSWPGRKVNRRTTSSSNPSDLRTCLVRHHIPIPAPISVNLDAAS